MKSIKQNNLMMAESYECSGGDELERSVEG